MSSSRKYLELRPASNPSSGIWSPDDGSPQLTFNLGAQNTFLIGPTVRISGFFRAFDSPSTPPVDGDTVNANPRLGIYNIVDQLILKNGPRKGGTTLESIRGYNRMMSSYISLNSNLESGLTHLNSTTLQLPNYECFRQGVINSAVSTTDGVPFCFHLPSGLLSQSRISLSSGAGLGGLEITLMMAPTSSVVYSTDGATAINTASYQIKDCRLTCEVYVPSVDELSQLMKSGAGQLTYNSISSQLATVNSRNGIINFSLGLSRVKSIFINTIQSKALNNRLFDSMTTGCFINTGGSIAKNSKQINTRMGLKYPRDYDIDTILEANPNVVLADPQIVRNYSNAISKFVDVHHENYVSPETCKVDYTGATASISRIPNGGPVAGYGVSYDDHVGTKGESFKEADFGLEITTDLVTDNPQTMFLYALNENVLTYNSQGVVVQS